MCSRTAQRICVRPQTQTPGSTILNLLVVSSETRDQRDKRRTEVGSASHETYAQTVRSIAPECSIDYVFCIESGGGLPCDLGAFDGILFAGSPIAMHRETPETRAATEFMRGVFDSGTPSFGSCAGLQIAAAAAGGSSEPREPTMAAGFARGIVATDEGRDHPLLKGRPLVWDAPTMHSDVVSKLPEGACVLARSKDTPVEAVEIAHGNGVFWGVQYHPEISIGEIACTLRRRSDELISEGLAADEDAVERIAAMMETLDDRPERRDLAWQLGLDREITEADQRTLEIRNFIDFLRTDCDGRRPRGW